jgi:hypothetical protein
MLPGTSTNQTGASTEASVPNAACRWEGYGIGFGAQGQCARQHLTAHAANECFAGGGSAADVREIAGHCRAEAEEVQISCCFAGAVPSPAATAVASVDPLNQQLAARSDQTRDDLVTSADTTCANAGARLGDWNMIYEMDGNHPALLRFGCDPPISIDDTISVRVSGRPVSARGPARVFAECLAGHRLIGAHFGDQGFQIGVLVQQPGTYRCDGSDAAVSLGWSTATGDEYQIGPDPKGGSCALVVTSIRPRYQGTFAATLPRIAGDGPDQITLTEGSFDVAPTDNGCP